MSKQALQIILKQIERISSLDFSERINISSGDEDIDFLARRINVLADKLENKIQRDEEIQIRVNEVIEILMEYTIMDFSRKIKISDKKDEIDAIAAGLNTLGEELIYLKKEEDNFAQKLKRSNTLLKNNIYKLEAIFNNTPDAIVVVDMNNKIVEWNKASEELYGFGKEEVIGKNIDDIITTTYLQPFSQEEIIRILGEKEIWSGEVTQKTDRREVMTILSSQCYLKNESGNAISYLRINKNITYQKNKEIELKASEHKFRMLLESAPDAVVIVNAKGEITLVNSQTEKLFGYTKSELYGKTVELLIPTRFHDIHLDHRKNYFKEPKLRGMGVGMDLLGVKKDGTEFYLEISLSPLQTEQGPWISAAIRDVSQRKEIERTLEENEEKFNKAFQLSPAGLTLTNVKTGKWIEVNESFLEITGYKREEIIGSSSAELGMVSDEERDRMLEEIHERGMLKNKEVVFRKKTGENGVALFSNEKITIKEEPVILTTIYDITNRKEIESELQKKSEELSRSNKELEQFAYVASHDLQEPLRTITSYVQLLEKKYKSKLDADAIDFINFAVDGASRMQELIYSLLDYSRINRIKPFENTDMNEVIEEVLQDLSVACKESNAMINYKKLPVIFADRTLIGQLFFNLIGNAIKFRGDKPIKITISASKTKNQGGFHFVVKDNGIGIKKEYQERIFVLFQRLHSRDKYSGTGIGLAICQKIVERHNGKIWIESELNKGAEFHFTINPYGSDTKKITNYESKMEESQKITEK